jgi:hypothetical protein
VSRTSAHIERAKIRDPGAIRRKEFAALGPGSPSLSARALRFSRPGHESDAY